MSSLSITSPVQQTNPREELARSEPSGAVCRESEQLVRGNGRKVTANEGTGNQVHLNGLGFPVMDAPRRCRGRDLEIPVGSPLDQVRDIGGFLAVGRL